MTDYREMYIILCKAVDDAITALECIPAAVITMEQLKTALLKAEDTYINTTDPI